MNLSFHIVHAFAKAAFSGNPAGVCPLKKWLPDHKLQQIAHEADLPETAFFVKRSSGFELRWFTPTVEVDLCGHATLAAAYVIFNLQHHRKPTIAFHSKSGLLQTTRKGKRIELNFPSRPPKSATISNKIIEALGRKPRELLRSRDYLAVFDREQDVRDLAPDMEKLKKLDGLGMIVTAPGKKCDFVSRFFAPKAGIPEDPVTGSAHCTLIPFWSARLGKKTLHARQLSSRGGELFCQDMGQRVKIAGESVLYLTGRITI